jgi:hypothetical protein
MRKIVSILLLLCGLTLAALSPCTLTWNDINNEAQPKVVHVDINLVDLKDCDNENRDTLNNILSAMGGTTGSTGLSSTGDIKVTIDRDSNTTGSRFWVANHTADTLFRVADDSTAKFSGDVSMAKTLTVTGRTALSDSIIGISSRWTGNMNIAGVATFVSNPIMPYTASKIPYSHTDGSGVLTSTSNLTYNSTTSTFSSANGSFSGTLGVTGTTTLGKLIVGSGSYGSGSAQLFTSSNEGLLIYGKTGSTYDLAISNAANSANVFAVPTGTNNALFPGAVSMSSTLGVTGKGTLGDLRLSSFATQYTIPYNSNTSGDMAASSSLTFNSATNTFGTQNGTFSGTLGVTGIQTNSEAIVLNANGTPGTSRIYKSASDGIGIRGVTGSSNDFILEAADGTDIFRNTTGTTAVVFPASGGVSIAGTLGVTGTSTLTGAVGIGVAPSASTSLDVRNTSNTGTSQYGIANNGVFSSGATTSGNGIYSQLSTTGSYTMATGRGLFVDTPNLSTTTVTNLIGLDIASQTGGGTNYAIRTGASGLVQLGSLTASSALATDASKNLVSVTNTGTGNNVLSASPTLTGTIAAASQTLSGSLTIGTTATTTGVHTFTAAPVFSSATASLPMFTDGTKSLVSNAMTGTGSVVMSASPTLTGTANFANTSTSGTALTSGVHTFTLAPVFSAATVSTAAAFDASKNLVSVTNTGTGNNVLATSPAITSPTVATSITASYATASTGAEFDGSKNLVSVTKTGTGNDVYSASPTLTGTIAAASQTLSGTLGVTGVTTATGGLTLGASFVDKTTSLTSNTTLTSAHSTIFASASGGSFTLTLPAAAGNTGLTYTIYKTDISAAATSGGNTVTIDGNASETIGGDLTIILGGNTANSSLKIICDGSNWMIQNLYDYGSFLVTANGFTTSPTVIVKYSRVLNTVTLNIDKATGLTSNSTNFNYTSLLSFLRPADDIYFPILAVTNNGATALARAEINIYSGSQIYFLLDHSLAWTNVNGKGTIDDISVTYALK